MFQSHRISTVVGAIGAAIVLGHVVLGRTVVPPAVAVAEIGRAHV